MKKALITIFALILCFIPTVVAYVSFNKTQNAPVDEETAVQISIDDINGKNITRVKEVDGDEADLLIRFFMQMSKNAQQIGSLPESLLGEKFFNVQISTTARTDISEYYFSTDPTACYMKAQDGTAYKLAEGDASVFIATEYAESLYKESAMPVLTLSHEYILAPDSAVWQYKNYTGSYIDTDVSSVVVDNVEKYEITGALDLLFDMQPDLCTVTVTDADGTVMYDDVIGNISSFKLDASNDVTVDVIAKWYTDPVRSFCGEVHYKFGSFVSEPAEFYLGLTTVGAGKFTAITGVNVTKASEIVVTSSMANTIAPVFYQFDPETAVGFLAVDPTTESGLYTVSFSYGGSIVDTVITVENDGEKSSSMTVDQAVVNSARSSDAISAFDALVKELGASGSATKYFEGSFLDGSELTFLRGFGRYIYLNGADEPAFITNGVDYAADAGTGVLAWNNGVVDYVGYTDYTGNVVVIDHGLGLRTWYWNLSYASVNKGDSVSKGDVVGTAGNTGFAAVNGAHIAMSVGNAFVSPYDTWSDSLIAGKVIIPRIEE